MTRSLSNPSHRGVPRLGLFLLLAAIGVACKPLPPNAPEAAAPAESAEPPAPALDTKDAEREAARQRARAWLALVDQGQYAESWQAAAPLFQSSTTMPQWERAVQRARGPLGQLSKRELRAAEYKTSLEGAPGGEYVVVHYDSAFATKPTAREVVTLVSAPNDSWQVVGYFIE